MKSIKKFLQKASGATAIEYGLIAALISVAIIGSLNSFGSEMGVMYDYIETTIKDATVAVNN